MPLPLLPLIAIGAGLAGQGINAATQGAQNRKARQFAVDRYNVERKDSLTDWATQNAYNHPSSQMARLREAGLNPNLVYGSGTAANTASMPNKTNTDSWKPQAPQFDLGAVADQGISTYYDTQIKQAQIDNLRTQNTVAEQEALLKAAQVVATTTSTEKTAADTAETKFDTQLKQELKNTSVEAAIASLEKKKADVQYTLDENERKAASNATSLREAAERILNLRMQRTVSEEQKKLIREQIENLKRDVQLKDLDIELKRLGIQPGDSMFSRILGRVVNSDVPTRLKQFFFPDKKGRTAPKGIMSMPFTQ